MDWFNQHAEEVLDQAFPGETPLPIVVKTTSRLYSKLVPAFQSLKVLGEMTEQQRQEVTVELYDHEKRQQEEVVRSEMFLIRGDLINFSSLPHKSSNYIVPAAYRSLVSWSSKPTIKQVLEEIYRHAYRFSPPEFFTQYRNPARGTNNLWKATRHLSALLLKNSINANMVSLRMDKIALDIVQKFLYGKWKIVRADHAIQEPESGNTARAWTLLGDAFKPGVKNTYVRDTVLKLLNPPYGYDYNTLTLLISAWIGYYQHDLQFTSMGRQISLDGLTSILNDTTGKKTFISEICGPQKVGISRRDSVELVREAKNLIERVNKETFDQETAEEIIAKLQAYCEDAALPEETCSAAQSAAERLSTGLEQARTYDQQAKSIRDELENDRDIQAFIQLKNRINDLPRTSLVTPKQKSLSDLDTSWRGALQQKVELECSRLSKVTHLQDVRYNQDRLEGIKRSLNNAKLTSLVEKVQAAVAEIARREKDLEAQELEVPVQTEIRAMDRRMPLKKLYSYLERLEQIQGFSQPTMALRDQRQRELTEEKSQLEQMADILLAGVDGIESSETAKNWESNCLRSYARFEGTAIQERLDVALKEVEQIQTFFMKLREIELRPRNSLNAVKDVIDQLEALQAETQSWLGGKARQALERVVQKVKGEKEQHCEETHKWLNRVESMFERGDSLAGVVRELGTSKSFLSSDDASRLEALKQRVQRKQEEDVIAYIEVQFRGIAEPSLRQECLRRLQAIASEVDAVRQ